MRPGNPVRWVWNQITSLLRALVRLAATSCSPQTPGPWIFLALITLYLALVRYCSITYSRDPTSAFFDPLRGYQRHYSLPRQKQADAFIEKYSISPTSPSSKSKPPKQSQPKLCIGISTVARDSEQYVRSTIGSLLEPLSTHERAEIHLAVLIAHTTPTSHPIYTEPWLSALTDTVLLYTNNDDHNDIPREQADQLAEWERDKNFVHKAIFDYTYVMQRCVDTGADWIAMIEDDTLAVMNWYPRLLSALEQVDDLHHAGSSSTSSNEWLYLRIFFTEEFLGWNSEEWPFYLLASTAVVAANALFLLLLRPCFTSRQTHTHTQTLLTPTTITIWSLFFTPLLILLFFLSGRLRLPPLPLPIPAQASGVHVRSMPHFGCCAQGLIFPPPSAVLTIQHLKAVGAGFVDEIIEAWANREGLERWAAVPSLLQHIGGHSSKGDDFLGLNGKGGGEGDRERSVAEKIWSFGFEGYDDRAF